jgi:hypothetical protein
MRKIVKSSKMQIIKRGEREQAYNLTSLNEDNDQPLTDPSRDAENKTCERGQTTRDATACVCPKRMWRRDNESNLMSMIDMLQSALPVMATSPFETTHETTPECGTRLRAAGQVKCKS